MNSDVAINGHDINAKLRKVVDIHNLEADLRKSFEEQRREPERLTIDLSEMIYIDISALAYLVAFISNRKDRELITNIELPQAQDGENSVIDFIRAWQFPEALQNASGTPFESFLTENAQSLFIDHKKKYDVPRFIGGYLQPGIGRILSDRFFAFRSFWPQMKVDTQSDKASIAIQESNRWQEDLIRKILSKHMSKAESSPGLVGSAVVFESIINALRHANANIIQTASRFSEPHKRKNTTAQDDGSLEIVQAEADPIKSTREVSSDENPVAENIMEDEAQDNAACFKLIFWDNGESSITTLRNAAKQASIANEVPSALHRNYWLCTRQQGKSYSIFNGRLFQSAIDIPSTVNEDEHFLLSTFFPGVTCDSSGPSHTIHPKLNTDVDALTEIEASSRQALIRPGMGLYLLTNVAVDVFGGSVSFRTQNLSLTIDAAPDRIKQKYSAHYRAVIVKLAPCLPSFSGNLLTVRLPLLEAQTNG